MFSVKPVPKLYKQGTKLVQSSARKAVKKETLYPRRCYFQSSGFQIYSSTSVVLNERLKSETIYEFLYYCHVSGFRDK
jgi:hypothetical protein